MSTRRSLMDRWLDRRERLIESVVDRWDRFAIDWARRRGKIAHRFVRLRRRWRRSARRVSDHWYRSLDRWAHRRDRVTSRWYEVTDQWAERFARQRAERRAVVVFGWLTCLAIVTSVTASVIAATVGLTTNESQPQASRQADAPRATLTGIRVPDVRGDSASAARRTLMEAGLSLEGVQAWVGAPGRVLHTEPSTGHLVDPRTPVTLFVGVETERAEIVLQP